MKISFIVVDIKKVFNNFPISTMTSLILLVIIFGELSNTFVIFDILLFCFSSEELFCSSTGVSACSTNFLTAFFKLFTL